MGRMRRWLAGGIALATLLGPVTGSARTGPAGAGSGAERARTVLQRSEAPFVVAGRPGDRPQITPSRVDIPAALAALRGGRDGVDLRLLGVASRALMRSFGPETAEPAVLGLDDEGSDVIHIGRSAGDVDGDGLGDVLDFEVPVYDQGFDLVTRSGVDGAELWRMPVDGLDVSVLPVPALTGPGTDALVVLQLYPGVGDGFEDCSVEHACLGARGSTYTWELAVLDPATGEVRWTARADGAFGSTDQGVFPDGLYAFGYGAAATSAILAVDVGDDHDGDGRRDLITNDIDILQSGVFTGAFSEDAYALAFTDGLTTATRAEVVSATGTPLYARAGVTPGLSVLVPGVDGVGTSAVDLLWDQIVAPGIAGACAGLNAADPDGSCAPEASAFTRSIELIDGTTFTPAWKRDLAPGWVFPSGGDLDGDGRGDLTLLAFEEVLTTNLISGADGVTAWTAPEILLGPSAGIGVTVSVGFDDTSFLYDIVRRDGATGEEITRTSHAVTLPTDAFDIFLLAELNLIADADGDGASDAMVQTTIFARGVSVSLVVERGTDGTLIWTRDTPFFRYLLVTPDLDGDGLVDAVDVTETLHRKSVALHLGVRSVLAPQPQHWDMHLRVFPEAGVWLDDLAGAGASDLVLSAAQRRPDGMIESSMTRRAGSTGAVGWSVGADLTEPLPPATGGVAGTITGDGSPFPGACVSAFDPTTGEGAFALAEPDGTYLMTELEDGSYILAFQDCFLWAYQPEFYDDAPTEEEATLVDVTGGAVTPGIDADLAPFGS